ncbi:MAG: DnaD domain protein [Ruminiclostridium sp.]|nr:DnaD domain protein [Ruminiclostridium sp.]
MDHRINLGAWRKVFAVPSCIVDEHHLKLASGTQIKVLLYLLAYPDVGIKDEIIASELGISKEDVSDALLYWVNAQVLSVSGSEYYPSDAPHSAAPDAAVHAAPSSPDPHTELSTPEARAALNSETHFPPKIIAGAVNGDKAVKYLFDTYERLAGRPPRHAEQQTLMILVEEIGLPCEVTMMLIEYCFNIDKATPAYMKSVARDWIESGIDDIRKAEERIRQLQNRNTAENRLHAKFGLSSAFSVKQKQMIAEWTDMGISDALIDEAYDITINNTGKLSFPYMDKILRKWSAEGITDPSRLEKRRTQDPAADNTPSFNTSEIEQRAYDKYKNL